MNKIKELGPLFTAGIFFAGFLALLLTGFGIMLRPIEANQVRFENRLNSIEAGFERRLDRIEVKLDQFLIQKKAMAK